MRTLFKIITVVLIIYSVVSLFLYIQQESLLFQASSLEQSFKYQFEQPFEEIFITTQDKAVLNGIRFKVENAQGIIVYYHGNAGDLSRWGKIVEPFTRYGYEVLIMDYRGYGKSSGKRTSKMMYKDAILFYNKAKEYFNEDQIIVYGRSLGCSFASWVAAEGNPQQLILETPFYSLKSIVEEQYWFFPFTSLLEFRFPTYRFIEKIKCPITFFHGTDDLIVPYDNGLELYKSTNNAQLITIEGGGHNNLSDYPNYWEAINKILK